MDARMMTVTQRHLWTRLGRAASGTRVLGLALGLSIGIAAMGASSGSVVAQSATPDAVMPNQSCALPPLSLPLFGGTPAAQLATPMAAIDLASLTPLDAATEASIRDGVDSIIACINSGDPRQVYAIFTTAYLARTYGDPTRAYLPAFEQKLDGMPMPPTSPFALDDLTIAGAASDGHAVITLTISAGATVWTTNMALLNVDGHWLIDAVLPE